MKANTKAIHHVAKSNAFRADCGEDAPKHRTVWLKKVTCKRCLRVIESQIVARKRRAAAKARG